uniref:Amino acid transporter transmembrane domain-containing protein n=1 Tax=Aplanochytrium stocchinoi TaxID=215587 RepID=A0A7S3LKT7_9STRA|mmetsp:Transcript_15627/g.18616  ORF Transcript_15627/g.18616 Transcript_15627/m.18616 type:complete len:222 (-) Transcript_15627:119-784(-)
MSFAFVCQHSTFIVFNTLKIPTVRVWRRVAIGSLTIVGLLSILLSLSGYLSFFNETQANILNNFPRTGEPAIDAARMFLAMTMILTFPMELFVARHALNNIIFGDPSNMPIPTTRHVVITLSLWTLALIVALTVSNLGLVLELVGAFSGSMIGYIFPALCYLKVRRKNRKALKRVYSDRDLSDERLISSKVFDFHLWANYSMLIFGVIAMITGSVLAIKNA